MRNRNNTAMPAYLSICCNLSSDIFQLLGMKITGIKERRSTPYKGEHHFHKEDPWSEFLCYCGIEVLIVTGRVIF